MKTIERRIKKVYVVSHTHWDREWYQDFQGFRVRLVYLIDELLDNLEQDPDYRHFTLDGQTIILEDYLEIRPEQRERLKRLIGQGRISIGPWYVMPDEFLVSGESLIRNLLKGSRMARSWGVEPMRSGYITDIFGHNSQLPQILRGFGFDNAVLFRGFYGDADPSEVLWEGADGSQVLTLKLDEDRSYGDFFFFLRWPFSDRDFQYEREELVGRAKEMLAYKKERATTNLLLSLDGVDHVEIEPQLPRMLKTLNEADLGVEFVHSTLECYLEELRSKVSDLRVYRGEQRSPGYRGANNWLLANVLSSRVHLKQNNHLCETLLEKWAEPWGVFTAWEGRPYPASFLNKAWEFLLQNHPHDSICGCSIDQVHKDMLYRFDQSRLISEQMIHEELSYVVNHLETEELGERQAVVIFNPSQSPIDGILDIEIALPTATDAAVTMPQFGGTSFRLYDIEHNEVPYQLLGVCKDSVRRWRPHRDIPYTDFVDRYRIALHAQVPSLGYTTYQLEPYKIEAPATREYHTEKFSAPVRYPGSLRVRTDVWDNGRVRLAVQPSGTVTLMDHKSGHSFENLLWFEDEADVGEGWNHVAPVTNEVVTSLGAPATVSVVHDGRFLTRLCIRSSIHVPSEIDPSETQRGSERVALPITTFLDLRQGDPVIRCRTVIRNTARDHRLRLLFPTGISTDRFYTSTPFDLVERPIERRDYSTYLEKAREVVPHNGIIYLSDGDKGLAVYSRGLYECALFDDEARTIALTLFRSTRKEVLKDDDDGGQLLGDLEFRYALRPFMAEELHPGQLWLEHQQFVTGVRSVDRRPGKVVYESLQRRSADLPLQKSFLKVEGSDLVVTAVKRSENEEGGYIVRLFNSSGYETTGVLKFDRRLTSAKQVNLDERLLRALPVDGQQLRVSVQPKQIMTVEVTLEFMSAIGVS